MADPIKLVHTADVHLDLCFAGVGASASFGNRRRQSLRDTFQRIVQRAGDWPADALLIAGDLVEGDRVTRDTIQFLRAEFASIPHVPVVIAPGNHDPFVPTSPYATENWPENVHVFANPTWDTRTLLDGRLVVHGFAFDGPEVSTNPFPDLKIPEDDAVHIAVAHGSERGHQPEEKQQYAPFDAAEVAQSNLAYLALGHFHGYTPISGDYRTTICYSGAPEGHGFRETGEHVALEVVIEGAATEVTPRAFSRCEYLTTEISCDEFESSQEAVQALRALAANHERRLIARVTFTGAMGAGLGAELESIYDAVAGEYEHLELADDTDPVEDFDALARQDTSLGLYVRALNAEMQDQDGGVRGAMLERAREIGVAAFRERRTLIRGLDRGDA